MLPFHTPVTEIIAGRKSCRMYARRPVRPEHAGELRAFLNSTRSGPLGAPLRFTLAAAVDKDRSALKGLGTYGLIRDTPGFIIGAVGPGEKNLEDFGYAMEMAVLYAAQLGLGTCWLGGNFTRSTFSRRIRAAARETVPCVAAVGYAAGRGHHRDPLGRLAHSHTRLPWEALFFCGETGSPLTPAEAGRYAGPLEMLRLSPSSRNLQPWRVMRAGADWRFFLARSGGYGPGSLPARLLGLADLQRVDMGIAMCHFELAAREAGLAGAWVNAPGAGGLDLSASPGEYVITWREDG